MTGPVLRPARGPVLPTGGCQCAAEDPFAALAPVRLDDVAGTRGAPAPFRSSTIDPVRLITLGL